MLRVCHDAMNLRPLAQAAWLLACTIALVAAVGALGSLVMLWVKGPYMDPRRSVGAVGFFFGLEAISLAVLVLGLRRLLRERS